MNRRDLLISGTGAIAGAAISNNILASTITRQGNKLKRSLPESLGNCIANCELCISHCINMIEQGNMNFQNVLHKTRECLAICKAMLTLATFESTHRREMAAICTDVCNECARECDVHAAHSEICSACAEACRECASLCQSI